MSQTQVGENFRTRVGKDFLFFVYFSDLSFFYPAKALRSGSQNQREIQLERHLSFWTFIYVDEQAPGKLLSHYPLSKM